MQEFGEQNPLLCKQLGDAVAKLMELQRHTLQQVQDRANRLKKVRCSRSDLQLQVIVFGFSLK